MSEKRKEIEKALIVTNVSLKGDNVILDLRFGKLQPEEPTESQLDKIIEPLPQSQMEKVGRDLAKGYTETFLKQMQQQSQLLQPFLPPTPPYDTIRITLSKQEYIELGRPTVDDKLILILKMTMAP